MTLQRKLGVAAASIDRAALIAAANERLKHMAPALEDALLEQRALLRQALRDGVCLQTLFGPAHQLRALAAPAGRPRLGALADLIARFVVDSADMAVVQDPKLLESMARALERAFECDDGDAMLTQALALLTTLLCAPSMMRSAGALSSRLQRSD